MAHPAPVVPPFVVVDDLSKRFGAVTALRRARFSIHRGEILGLIGPNGSGKTTLFECVAGTMPADSGVVRIAGDAQHRDARKHSLFYMPDAILPWPDQTVEWTLRLFARLYGCDDATRAEVMAALAIETLRRTHMGALSKGERKRVLLAASLLTSQPLLLLDEPFDGLDLRQTRDTMDVLRTQRARGRTLFLSIHQLGDAAKICDRFVLLSGGDTVGEGTLEQLRECAGLAAQTAASLEEVFLALT
jgi:ABC-type multidrug transport system ATPase subunit